MVQLTCPIEGCSYVTVDGSEVIACALLAAHTPAHVTIASAPMTSGLKLDRPKIDIGVTLEQWNMFERRWDVFVTGSGINPTHSSPQLFQCRGVPRIWEGGAKNFFFQIWEFACREATCCAWRSHAHC